MLGCSVLFSLFALLFSSLLTSMESEDQIAERHNKHESKSLPCIEEASIVRTNARLSSLSMEKATTQLTQTKGFYV